MQFWKILIRADQLVEIGVHEIHDDVSTAKKKRYHANLKHTVHVSTPFENMVLTMLSIRFWQSLNCHPALHASQLLGSGGGGLEFLGEKSYFGRIAQREGNFFDTPDPPSSEGRADDTFQATPRRALSELSTYTPTIKDVPNTRTKHFCCTRSSLSEDTWL